MSNPGIELILHFFENKIKMKDFFLVRKIYIHPKTSTVEGATIQQSSKESYLHICNKKPNRGSNASTRVNSQGCKKLA